MIKIPPMYSLTSGKAVMRLDIRLQSFIHSFYQSAVNNPFSCTFFRSFKTCVLRLSVLSSIRSCFCNSVISFMLQRNDEVRKLQFVHLSIILSFFLFFFNRPFVLISAAQSNSCFALS